jgi:carboxylesterase
LRPLGQDLAAAGWHTCGTLLPGFGAEIGSLGRYTRVDWLKAVRRDWHAQVEAHHPNILVGYSMGGALALNLAAELKPDGLVLIAPFLKIPGLLPRLVPLLRYFVPDLRPYEKADLSDPQIRAQLRTMLNGADLDDPQVQAAVRQQVSLPLRTLHEILRLGAGAAQQASLVDVPTLILQGVQDATVPPAGTRRLVPKLGRARMVYQELEGGHHVVDPAQEGYESLSQSVLSFAETLR